jgi:hypothetical protein
MNETIYAYCAGLFDGEGYIDIYSATLSKASKSPSLYLRVVISQKDGMIMNWLEDNFGGYVRKERRNENYIYRWTIVSKSALKFLNLIYPFVLIKKEQVKLALEFQEMKSKYIKDNPGFRKIPSEEIQTRIETKDKLKELKKNYTNYIKKFSNND